MVVVNNLRSRGRRLGLDVWESVRARVPLVLYGMDSRSVGGEGEIENRRLPETMAAYRFFLAKPDAARAMARAWGVNYVTLCPENMREKALDRYRPGSAQPCA